jgi:hypothetical protein
MVSCGCKGRQKKGVGTFLIRKSIAVLEKDARVTGYKHFYGVFDEVNAVSKMSAEEIAIDKRDSMDPVEREKFWEKRGFRVLGFNYIQPPCVAGMQPCEYLHLRMLPLSPKVMGGIPSDLMSIILYNFLKEGIVIPRPEKEPVSRLMLEEVRRMKVIPIF